MRAPLSWLREYVDVPVLSTVDLERAFVRVGLEVEEITDQSATVTGPLVVGRVEKIEELAGLKKPIRYCQVDVGTQTRGRCRWWTSADSRCCADCCATGTGRGSRDESQTDHEPPDHNKSGNHYRPNPQPVPNSHCHELQVG